MGSGLSYMGARYYDPALGRFLSQDPVFLDGNLRLDDPQMLNSYSYARNNPLVYVDPDGKEPVKAYVGTIEDFIRVLNNSPRQVGGLSGEAARAYVASLGNTESGGWRKLWVPQPTQTAYFNNKEGRYIYTENGGWIDMSHFMFYAGQALQLKESGAEDPVGGAILRGYAQEAVDSVAASRSAFSYEDLPSDRFGAEFGANHFDPNSKSSLSDQLKTYFKNVLGSTYAQNAPNYDSLPAVDTNSPPSQTNYSINPKNLAKKIKR